MSWAQGAVEHLGQPTLVRTALNEGKSALALGQCARHPLRQSCIPFKKTRRQPRSACSSRSRAFAVPESAQFKNILCNTDLFNLRRWLPFGFCGSDFGA